MAPCISEATQREVKDFLIHEAELLDDRRFEEWLEILAEDVLYQVPIQTGHDKNGSTDLLREGAWLSENWKSLEMRIRRLRTPGVLAEEPPSRTRHFVSNIRITPGASPKEVRVRSNLLLYRSRGESVQYDLFSGERRDILRRVDGRWSLARRDLLLDMSTLDAQDLSIIL